MELMYVNFVIAVVHVDFTQYDTEIGMFSIFFTEKIDLNRR